MRSLSRGILYAALFVASPCAAMTAQMAKGTCAVVNGGGGMRVHGFETVFFATADSVGVTLHGLTIVRTAAEFLQRPTPRPRPTPPRWPPNQASGRSGGATVGQHWIVHEETNNIVWIDSLPIRLDGQNNVLLLDVDAQGVPSVAGQARIDPRVPVRPSACNDAALLKQYEAVSDTLWAHFRASAEIRSFLLR